MEHTRTAPHRTAPRKALACLLALALILSPVGALLAHGAETSDLGAGATAMEPGSSSAEGADATAAAGPNAKPDAEPITGGRRD
jgi:hypothetical protein